MIKELLTENELKILQQLITRKNRKEIAKNLNISFYNCNKIIKNLLIKFEVDNLVQCMIKAYIEGFIKL